MALNIPVNLMSTTTLPVQSHSTAAALNGISEVKTVPPVSSSSDTRNAGADSNSMNRGSSEQQALTSKWHSQDAGKAHINGATPKSVVVAQTDTSIPAPDQKDIAQTPRTQNTAAQSELDRYAPPDPLPTAPILLAAASYAVTKPGAA